MGVRNIPKYNLNALEWQEFERLCQALIQQIIGPGAKIYGMGRDGAREATFEGKATFPSKEEQWDGRWIFQAKFHDVPQIGPPDARKRLLDDLDNELSIITERYSCDNYILMTNVSLTPVLQTGTKDKIDNEITPKYPQIKHIHVCGAEEICRFLDANPDIRQSYIHLLITGDIVASLLKTMDKGKTDLTELIKLYCQGCFIHQQYAALDDAGDVDDERVELQRVFVDLNVKPRQIPKDQQILKRFSNWLIQAAEDENRMSALSYLLDDSIPGLVLIGGPGSGKSTLCQYLAQIYRARLIGKLDDLQKYDENIEEYEKCTHRIPFRVVLREYAQWVSSPKNQGSLFHYLAFQVSKKAARDTKPEDIHELVKFNPVLLILDGLDEVPEKELRRKVFDYIASFVDQVKDSLEGDLRVIATTRPYGYSDEFAPSHYLHLSLQKFEPPQARKYAQRWMSVREPIPDETERIQNTFDQCLKDEVICVLTQTPLQVTILLVIIRARGRPPNQREELFDSYVNVIYQREQKKSVALLRTEKNRIYGLHAYIAYLLHKRAETDKTAALMEMSEFREKVKEYLADPLLDKKELEEKTEQIITEASQRLVLIECPQEGKIGFGLTTIREFFAAAHLVDTAENTKERDERFKAIATLPHWRNVVLFFAGRVGRNIQGEASNMIDVCYEIDSEKADKCLKRGAQLAMKIIEDRALREPRTERSALRYALEILDDVDYIIDIENWTNMLKGLSEKYKERLIQPWLTQRLKSVKPEKSELYIRLYQELYDVDDILREAIESAAKCSSKDVKLWALFQTIKNNIYTPWFPELLEELGNTFPIEKIIQGIKDYWFNLSCFLNFQFSSKGRTILAQALFEGARISLLINDVHANSIIEMETLPDNEFKKNYLLMWAICQYAKLTTFSSVHISRRTWPMTVVFPFLFHPKTKKWINENLNYIEKFCNTFSREPEPLANYIVCLFEFLLEPDKANRFNKMVKHSLDEESTVLHPRFGFRNIWAFSDDKISEYHKDLFTLLDKYISEELLRKDLEELNEIINRTSNKITNHPFRLLIWMLCGCAPSLEIFLDSEILSKLRNWLESRNLSENVFSFCSLKSFGLEQKIDFTTIEFIIETIEKQFGKDISSLGLPLEFAFYHWDRLTTEQQIKASSRLNRIFYDFLTNYHTLIDPQNYQLMLLYSIAFSTGIIEEKHMAKVYETIKNIPSFLEELYWFTDYLKNRISVIIDLLKSDDARVSRLTAVSLAKIDTYEDELWWIDETWVGDKLWELAKNKEDPWHPYFIKAMSLCKLKWAEWSDEWLKDIENAETEDVKIAWCKVIEEAGYSNIEDCDAIFNFLLSILYSGNTFKKFIRVSALRRLHKIIYEVQKTEFDEISLNLPLPRKWVIYSS